MINKSRFIKSFVLFAVLLVLLFGCKKSQQKELQLEKITIQSLLTKWEFSIKTKNYKLYSLTKLNPLSNDDFLAEFDTFYYQNVQIMDVKDKGEKEIQGALYTLREISLAAETVKRSNDSKAGMITGTVEIVRLDEEDSHWKLYNKTLMHNY